MNSKPEKDYPLLKELAETDLDENSSLKKMLRLVGKNKRVVDFGCATGYFARWLTSKGCQVTGVEVNSEAAKTAQKYCREVIIADLDFVPLAEILPGETFDVAVFGDILEHLRNPWKILEETRYLLKPEGCVVASIPNIAHGAIRLALLQGNFEYMELGILDNTHLRFFTRKTVNKLFEKSGYFVDVIEQTKLPIFSASNWIPPIDKDRLDKQIVDDIGQDEDADTLQFVVQAYPLSMKGKYTALNQKYSQVLKELEASKKQLELVRTELHKSQLIHQEQLQEIERSRCVFERESHAQKQQIQEISVQTQQQLQEIQLKLQQAHIGWEHCQQIIAAMKTSKFWKLRQVWFDIKKSLGLKAD